MLARVLIGAAALGFGTWALGVPASHSAGPMRAKS